MGWDSAPTSHRQPGLAIGPVLQATSGKRQAPGLAATAADDCGHGHCRLCQGLQLNPQTGEEKRCYSSPWPGIFQSIKDQRRKASKA